MQAVNKNIYTVKNIKSQDYWALDGNGGAQDRGRQDCKNREGALSNSSHTLALYIPLY